MTLATNQHKSKKLQKKKLKKIYVNTLMPDFEFKSKNGTLIKFRDRCITL